MSDRPEARRLEEATERGHELRDLSSRTLVAGMVALAVMTVLAAGLMAGLLGWFEERDATRRGERSPLVEIDVRPPDPQLETEPAQILEQLRAVERAQLESWVWLDRDAGLARIPIDRAMEIVAERGLPHRDLLGREEER